MFDFNLERMLLTIPGIIIGLAFHEFAHAFVSDRLGDPTPRKQGRLTLSPLPHIDVLGLIMIVLLGFGWAKPVQIDTRYYKKPKRDEILVSIAGPLANLVLAVVFTLLMRIFLSTGTYTTMGINSGLNVLALLSYTVSINVVLFLFNLIPVPPLDGFHVLSNVVPLRNYRILNMLQQYSFIILILLIVSNATRYIIGIPASFITEGLFSIFGIFNFLGL